MHLATNGDWLAWNPDIATQATVMHMVRKDNAFTFADSRSGMFVMLTSADTTFDEMMTSYDVREIFRLFGLEEPKSGKIVLA